VTILRETGKGVVMGAALRIVALCCVISLVAGCFQVETRVSVKPDGSGVVEERMLISDKVAQQIDEMAKAFAGPEGKTEPFSLHDRKKLVARAREMGEGVALVSSREVHEAGYTGYVAVYSFRDITRVRLSSDGAKKMAESGEKDAARGEKPILFRFTPGKTARLVVIPPGEEMKAKPAVKEAAEKSDEEGKPKPTPEQEKEAREMLKGMRFSFVIEVKGHVVESNATHREGNRITLFDFDFDKMGANMESLQSLKRAETLSFAEAKDVLKGIPGFKMDMNDRLEILFSR
jgi:hypothetical protein